MRREFSALYHGVLRQRQIAVVRGERYPRGGQIGDHRQTRILGGEFAGKPGFPRRARQALVLAKQIQLEAGNRAVGFR